MCRPFHSARSPEKSSPLDGHVKELARRDGLARKRYPRNHVTVVLDHAFRKLPSQLIADEILRTPCACRIDLLPQFRPDELWDILLYEFIEVRDGLNVLSRHPGADPGRPWERNGPIDLRQCIYANCIIESDRGQSNRACM